MLADAVVYFVALSVSFFLFYFNAPYWTGKGMADLSKSGIWRAAFRFLSFIGYGICKVFDLLSLLVQGWVAARILPRGDLDKLQSHDAKHPVFAIFDVIETALFAGIIVLLFTNKHH